MEKKIFKILSVSLGMLMLTCLLAFVPNAVKALENDPDGGTVPSAEDTTHTITVNNVNDENAVVTAYQVIEGVYSHGKLAGYQLVDDVNAVISNFEAPDKDEITLIADNISNDRAWLTPIVMTKDDSDSEHIKFTADVEAGLYVVIVTNASDIVYNPAIVAVNIADANDIDNGGNGNTGLTINGHDYTAVDMLSYWNIPSTAWLKSSTSGFDKVVLNNETLNTQGILVHSDTNGGGTIGVGDIVSFGLQDMVIPSYSTDYGDETLIYEINDTLNANGTDVFKGINHFYVYVYTDSANKGNPVVGSANCTVTFYDEDDNVLEGTEIGLRAVRYTLSFTDDFIRANAEKQVFVTYDTTVQDGMELNYSENITSASLRYSVNATTPSVVKTLTANTYHYSFGVDAVIDAQAGSGAGAAESYELNKVSAANGTYSEATGVASNKSTQKSAKALAGATFELRNTRGDVVGTATSDANGHLTFTGLNTGTYYLSETVPPDTYTLNANEYVINIKADVDTNGIMSRYLVDIQMLDSTTWRYVTLGSNSVVATLDDVDADTGALTYTVTPTITAGEVVNTKIAELPSTGGTGTIVLTVCAALGMGVFLTLYLVNKRKKVSE